MLSPLPIDAFLAKIIADFATQQNLILTAAPGAGKTTRLPPALLSLTDKKVLVLEPRRVAALAAASRIADEQGWQLGQEVGYQVRFENVSCADTRLLFVTEALLTRKLLDDPDLKDIGIVVLDEFHERSIHTDLALGLLLELQQLSRPDLKMVVMSATMDTQKISQFLHGAPVAKIPGQIFELQSFYRNDSQLLLLNHQFIGRVAEQIRQAEKNSSGDLLVFLPGVGEIERVRTAIQEWADSAKLILLPFHGSLKLSEQKKVLLKATQKKIVLATNVAESALTIDGVSTVVDCGLAKTVVFNPVTGLPKMQTGRISKASAAQRAGRAARQGPGRVFKMWNKMDELSMPDFENAEIHRVDLCEPLLFLANLGIGDFQNFSWFEPPQAQRVRIALEQLQMWGAISADKTPANQISDLGKQMSRLPLHPRLSRLFLEGVRLEAAEFAADLCAILGEKDFLSGQEQAADGSSDLALRWEILNGNRTRYSHLTRISEQILQIGSRWNVQRAGKKTAHPSAEILHDLLPNLMLAAYSDRLCRRRKIGQTKAVCIDGTGVSLTKQSVVRNEEFFVALQMIEGLTAGESLVSMASATPRALIDQQFSKQIYTEEKISFDEKNQRLVKSVQKKLKDLPLEDPRVIPLSDADALAHLPDVAFARWPEILQINPELQGWVTRYQWYHLQKTATAIQPLSNEWIQKSLAEASYGEKNFLAVAKKSLIYFFEKNIEANLLKQFHLDCPQILLVPSGSKISVQYFPDKNPIIEIRLQEVFGWNETPRVMQGQVPVTLHLLSPNYRPVQVTQDLSNFWKVGYNEVRKELRSRYPKHSWPDDPLNAKAEAKGRSRK